MLILGGNTRSQDNHMIKAEKPFHFQTTFEKKNPRSYIFSGYKQQLKQSSFHKSRKC